MDKSTISMAIFNSYVSLPEDGDLTTWRHWNVQVAAWYQPDQHTHTYIYYMFAAGTDSFLIGPWLGSMCLSWHAWSYMQCRCKLSREPFFAYQNHIFMQHHARAAQDIFSIFPRRPVFLCFTSMLMMVKWCSISIYLYFSWCTFSIIFHGLIIIFEHFFMVNIPSMTLISVQLSRRWADSTGRCRHGGIFGVQKNQPKMGLIWFNE